MRLISPEGHEDIGRLIGERGKSVRGIEVLKLWETSAMSQFLVLVKTSEQPHYHAEHDLTFMLLSGTGELYIEGRTERMEEGDVAFVPRGKVHFYRNLGNLSVLLATFSPPYKGEDSIPVEL